MLLSLAAASLATITLGYQPDTTIAVRPGTTLSVSNFGGSIDVRTWSKNAVRVTARHSRRDEIQIARDGTVLRIEAHARRWVTGSVEYALTVPDWMKLELSGVNTDITVDDSKGEVEAETVQGDITLRRGSGSFNVSSVQGSVRVEKVRGRVEASSVNQGVHVVDVSGTVLAESVNGPLLLENITADSVDASTLNGCVTYEGAIRDRGVYRFATHSGAIDVAIPEGASATINVATYTGGIDSSFPVTLKKQRSKRYEILLGSGSATMELESFQGTIYLRRPGEARAQHQDSGNCEPDEDDSEHDAKHRKGNLKELKEGVKDLKEDLKDLDDEE